MHEVGTHEDDSVHGATRISIDVATLASIAAVAAPTALVTGWLYYIGWVRTNWQVRYFGIDPTMLGYSTADYVLRSVTSLLGPGAFIVLTLVMVGVVRNVLPDIRTNRPDHWRRIHAGRNLLSIGGALLAVAGCVFLGRLGGAGFSTLIAGTLLVSGGLIYLVGRYITTLGKATASAIQGFEFLTIATVLSAGLFAGGHFYAAQVGNQAALSLERSITSQPEVHLLSPKELHLAGGTQCQPIRGEHSAFRCRYAGLRLLVATDDHYFLVPENWDSSTTQYLHVVSRTGEERLDIVRD